MSRSVQVVIVCEDILHETFVRAFLVHAGFDRRKLTFRKAPAGAGDAKQFVYTELPREVRKTIRKYPHERRAVLYVVDADQLTTEARRQGVDRAFVAEGVPAPAADEPGDARCEIRPQLGDRTDLDATAWTPHGPIRLQARQTDGRTEYDIDVPAGVQADLRLPDHASCDLPPCGPHRYRLEPGRRTRVVAARPQTRQLRMLLGARLRSQMLDLGYFKCRCRDFEGAEILRLPERSHGRRWAGVAIAARGRGSYPA